MQPLDEDENIYVDDEGFLCHADGTRFTMKMTLGTSLLMRAIAALKRFRAWVHDAR